VFVDMIVQNVGIEGTSVLSFTVPRDSADRAADAARSVAAAEVVIEPTLAKLTQLGVPYLIDPIIEPIGYGFMASLERYAEVRRRYPNAEMLMGIGNVTELTAADSTGVNALLIAICQELGIRSVLTTEVIPWARGAVREVDVARRLMHFAITRRHCAQGRGRPSTHRQGSCRS
jgi:hypothetical protein